MTPIVGLRRGRTCWGHPCGSTPTHVASQRAHGLTPAPSPVTIGEGVSIIARTFHLRLRTNSYIGPVSRTSPLLRCAISTVMQSVSPQYGHTGSTAATVNEPPPKRSVIDHSSRLCRDCCTIQNSTE